MKYLITMVVVAALVGCDKHDHDHKHDEKPAAGKVKDPVCGMSIDKGANKAEFDGADVYFCSDDCAKKFAADPAKYLKACACSRTMKDCKCGHCEKKRELCDCAEEKK